MKPCLHCRPVHLSWPGGYGDVVGGDLLARRGILSPGYVRGGSSTHLLYCVRRECVHVLNFQCIT